MIQSPEMKSGLPMELSNGVLSTTHKVWEILLASRNGDLEAVKRLAEDCRELLYAQYNYSPPILFAVREGHIKLVEYLLENDAYDPSWRLYPFGDDLVTIARDRQHMTIASLLLNPPSPKKKTIIGDNGKIHFPRSPEQTEFEQAVDRNDLKSVQSVLKHHPAFARDETYFWGEGILMMPAKENHREMIELLMRHGATVPTILKWTQFYYFERYDSASFMMQKGMNPNTMSWQHVTILHDMAQKGFIDKAELLISHGADLDALDEEYQSTPLGLASRWGHTEMVKFLLSKGADPGKAGARWATPVTWAKAKGHTEIETILRNRG